MTVTPLPCFVEEISHTAEIGLRVRAPGPGRLFACAGEAMFALVGATVDETAPPEERHVRLHAPDPETLLVDWLNELVYLYETTGLLFTSIDVAEWAPTGLEAVVQGRPSTTPPRLHVKAVTYHDLVVRPDGDGWLAQVTFDI
jgi:SHS2 domain-containing protein